MLKKLTILQKHIIALIRKKHELNSYLRKNKIKKV